MRKKNTFEVFFAAWAALTPVLWAGCNQITGIHDGKPYEDACSTVADCIEFAPECGSAECIDERCVYNDKPAGTPLEDIVGDCAEKHCDGAGSIEITPVLTDIPKDGNPCTLDYCNGIIPVNKILSYIPCYNGPPATRGIGLCAEGVQACDENAMPTGICIGEVLPREETCLSLFDDDCDGLVNESGLGCTCVPGTTASCFAGPEAALGNGLCVMGTQTCNANGVGYGDCTGQTTPTPERCSTVGLDDDCDGKIDEDGVDCVCGDSIVSATEACDDGNTDDADGCSNQCALSMCGNGMVSGSEVCDDGNLLDNDACTAQCQKAVCGDGLLQAGVEDCDDGNTFETDTCTSSCKTATCGDGFVRMGIEECDGSSLPTDTCLSGCIAAPVDIYMKADDACVRFGHERAKCWGANAYGELGLGDIQARGDVADELGDHLPFLELGLGRKIKSLAPGGGFTCALLDDGSVKCWGFCVVGACGIGDLNLRGDNPNEMADNLPAVPLGAGRTAKAINSGASHTCAILDNDTLKCWGQNTYGNLGQGDTMDRGNLPGQLGDTLPPISFGTNLIVLQTAGGTGFHCAILKDVVSGGKQVKCWGANALGQLGLGDVVMRGDEPGEMGDALPAVNLGNVGEVLQIDSTVAHTCALFAGGKVKCWGSNDHGQLGLGDKNNRGDASGEMGDVLPFVDLGTGATAVQIATDAIDRLHTPPESHHRGLVLGVMGRHAGGTKWGSGPGPLCGRSGHSHPGLPLPRVRW